MSSHFESLYYKAGIILKLNTYSESCFINESEDYFKIGLNEGVLIRLLGVFPSFYYF